MLIKTKFNIPFSGNKLLKRKRLFEKLDQYEAYSLIVVTAPAGYGKTALISSWNKDEKKHKKISWLTLDDEDNDEELFWSYFLLSFYRNLWIPVEMRERAFSLFRSTVPFKKSYLTYFINDVAELGMQFLMVLDDIGVINNEKIMQMLKFLIYHLPANLHLILSGRGYSEAGLAKCRASGNVLLLKREHICFTQEETVSFFRNVAHVNLTCEEYVTVGNTFEGWAAGLQMMALSVKEDGTLKRSVPFPYQLLSSYMMEEVIGGLDKDIIKFLMETSVFERFCPQLCDYVFNQDNSRQRIQELERINLFIIRPDGQEEWFRYHYLFREFLKNMLYEREDGIQPLLYKKASEWYESRAVWEEAVTFAVRGGEFEKAVVYIEACGREMSCRGKSGLLHKWNQQLPERVVKNNPRLLLNSAWAYSAEGKVPEMLQCVEELKKDAALSEQMRAEVMALPSSNLPGPDSDFERMLTECGQALRIIPPATFLAQLIYFNMGCIFILKGSPEEGMYYFAQCYKRSLETGAVYLSIISDKAMITSFLRKGQLQKAEQEILWLLKTAAGHSGEDFPVTGLLYAQLAEIYYHRNQLEEARKAAEEGSRLGENGEDMWSAGENYLVLEKIYKAMDDRRGYERIRKKALRCLEDRVFFDISLKMECYHAQILVQEGKLTLAAAQINNIEKIIGPELMAVYPEFSFLKARFFISKGRYGKSIETLNLLRTVTQANGQDGLLCEILVLLSTVYERMGNCIQAIRELEEAVALAQSQGRFRIFLNEGEIMWGMLKRLIEKKKTERSEPAFVYLLLDYFQMQPDGKTEKPEDLLSSRETDILKLVMQGADNAEIAERLFVSPNTVKTHLLHIYTKLGVHSRQKAAAKAMALQIF